MKKVIAIITADIHLRDTQPIARIDNYWETQWKKINQIKELQQKYNCCILDAGDLFHKSASSIFLNSYVIKNFISDIFTIPGNHDLEDHNINLIKKSNLSILEAVKKAHIIKNNEDNPIGNNIVVFGIPYTTKLQEIKINKKYEKHKKILLIHAMIFKNNKENKLNPFIEGWTAKQILKKYSEFDLIISGHNHKNFEYECENRKLINPGSMMRMKIDQLEHQPCFYLLYNDLSTEKIFFNIEKDIFDKNYIKEIILKKESKIKLDRFVDQLKGDKTYNINFKQNIENYFIKNDINTDIKNIIYKNME
jgi:predicted phosphodiesterase